VALSLFTVSSVVGPTVNCPVVPINSTLAGGSPNITLGWFQNQTINYFDFGPNTASVVPIEVFPGITAQHNIIDAIPTDPGYSAFWLVEEFTAPAGYVANTYKSFTDVANANLGSPVIPNVIVNCPVISTDPAPPASTTANYPPASTTAKSGVSQLIPSFFVLVSALLMLL